jgi:hypothetical protein
MEAIAGLGVSDAVVDRGFWLDDDDPEDWIAALEAIDKRGDKRPLVTLLKSQRDLSPRARFYLADLLDRFELKRPAHRPRTPAYDRTLAEAILLWGVQEARELVKAGMSVVDALDKAAKESSIPLEILSNAYEGKRGSTNRAKRRSRP